MSEKENNSSTIDARRKFTFSLGFVLAMAGAVGTAATVYAKLERDNEFLKAEVIELKVSNREQASALADLTVRFSMFVQQYDKDMNRWIRDRNETTIR